MLRTLPAACLTLAALLPASLDGASAADLPRREAPLPALPIPPAFTWTGFYLGVNAGYGFRGAPSTFGDATYGTVTQSSRDRGGFLGGVQAGYTYQVSPGSGLVLGLETDFQGTAFAKADAAYLGTTPYYSVAPNVDYFGTVRGRVGYAFDRVLIYGTGGFAYGGGSRSSHAGAYTGTLPDSSRIGYAVGGGLEYAFTERWSAKIEALYVNLRRSWANAATVYDASVPAYYGIGRTDPGFAIVRAGLNYRW
ncbi:outer membrane beta-barrel protein [Methylobacterium durans]|uniref:outer membrane protein n=1 Tax=Methylobacterium durans TaxID=2202825 RepID=UPI002AFF7D64|nr:outer membrane beta-barrel protein [Methylobacterium durans]MEA1831046.1 outer membrane beta-barrel protein [Methylobacterium durans]